MNAGSIHAGKNHAGKIRITEQGDFPGNEPDGSAMVARCLLFLDNVPGTQTIYRLNFAGSAAIKSQGSV